MKENIMYESSLDISKDDSDRLTNIVPTEGLDKNNSMFLKSLKDGGLRNVIDSVVTKLKSFDMKAGASSFASLWTDLAALTEAEMAFQVSINRELGFASNEHKSID